MQLEKATSRSGQASLAGWISSNDVALFTTVLVMAIAMFLHSRLTAGSKENVLISQEKATLTQRLDAAAGELDVSTHLLDKTREALNLSQGERDQLQSELLEQLDAISQLNKKLDALLREKGLLEQQHQSLIAAKESLTTEKAELMEQQAALVGDRDVLKLKNVALLDQLEAISRQLAAKIAALEDVEDERARLKGQADELEQVVVGLKQRLEMLNRDLSETRTAAATAHTAAQSRVQELESQLATRDRTFDEYIVKLKRASELMEGLKAEKTQLQRALSESELKRQAELLEEGRNYRELIGLTGRLERVAILFDASGSMRQAGTSGDERWSEAQAMAAKWLQHLNVQQCVLIVFSTEVQTFPEDGSLTNVRGEGGKANRDLLLQRVKAVTPGGWTNTFDALSKAYQYDVDSIVLFSDGAPTSSDSTAFQPAAAERIYELCRTHPNVAIHTVGLGNYFEQNASKFLMTLAKMTNGTFRGQ